MTDKKTDRQKETKEFTMRKQVELGRWEAVEGRGKEGNEMEMDLLG